MKKQLPKHAFYMHKHMQLDTYLISGCINLSLYCPVAGDLCESMGPCFDEPCENDAECTQDGSNYTCICTPGKSSLSATWKIPLFPR